MSDRLPWFRCFPSALLGALAGLQADEGFVYVVALMRIYETGGPVVETARTLARRTGMTERRADKALQELVSLGKLAILPNGQIDAESTRDEIEWQQTTRQKNSAAGKMSAEKRAGKTQQNQRISSTSVQRALNHKRVESKDNTSSLRSDVCETPDGATPKKGTILPDDWAAKDRHLGKAAERGFPAAFVQDQADRMRNWALSNSNRAIAKKADWDRTFDNWLGEAMDKAANRRPPPTDRPPRKSAQATFLDIAREAHEQLNPRSEDHERPFDGEILGPGRPYQAARHGHLTVYERPGGEAGERYEEGYPGRVRAFG